ncbi:YitT family protein [uncultured Alistipes sp.]|uniref:YitT family protein n=1 Tax=uncultured Alistipes sp. TaxID=538949 RepID=UPI0026703E7E|nr:YitT family protein [uncultured Alistipes sp.]
MDGFSTNRFFAGIKEYFLMTVGMFLYAFGWIGCILPADGMGGGAAGLSLVLCMFVEHLFGWQVSIGTMVFMINALLLLVAGFIVGWKFGIKTVFSIIMISVAMNFWESVLPPEGLFSGMENILQVILGGILAGSGVAICFMQGGSTGGVDIVAMIINKYRTVRYGNIVMCSDFIIIGSSLLVGKTLTTVVYGYILTAVFGYTVDMIMSGNQQSNQIFIMSRKYDEITKAILEVAHRGVTLLDGMGGYTREEMKVVVVVCRKRETSDVLKVVKSVDPTAFMSIGSVAGVYGQGFQSLPKM